MRRECWLAGVVAASLSISTNSMANSLTDGLVAHYQLDGNGSDSSGGANHGTAVGAATASDRFATASRALEFVNSIDASVAAADFVTVPDAPSLRPTGELTISAWINASNVGSIRNSILTKQLGTATNNSFALWLQTPVSGANGVLRFTACTVSSCTDIGSFAMPLNEWHHVAGTWDGSDLHLFLDGSEIDSGPFAGPVGYDTNPVLIGADDNDTDNVPDSGWNGRIDDARIYNRSLLPAEVKALHAARLIAPLAPTADVSGLQNNGTLAGAVATTDRFGGPAAALNFVNPLDFTATATDFISIPDHPSLRPASGLTVGAWIRPGANSVGHIVAKQFGSGDSNSYVLWIQDALGFALCNGADGCVQVFAATPATGEWHHVAGTWDGAVITLFVDGSPVATTPFGGPVDFDANPLLIGADENSDANDLPDRGFNGDIDDVQVFASSLSGCDLTVVATIGPPCVTCVDQDADGYGSPGDATCPAGPQTDCDDADANINPGTTEIPRNGLDDDCNPLTPGGCTPQLAEASVGTGAAPVNVVDLGLYLVPGYALVGLFRRSVRRRARA